jgi:hypothetical protein
MKVDPLRRLAGVVAAFELDLDSCRMLLGARRGGVCKTAARDTDQPGCGRAIMLPIRAAIADRALDRCRSYVLGIRPRADSVCHVCIYAPDRCLWLFERVTHWETVRSLEISTMASKGGLRSTMFPVTFPTPHEDLFSQRFADQLVHVRLETNEIFVYNPTGGRFSKLLVDDALNRRLPAQR